MELDKNAAVISYEEYYPFGSTSYRSGKSGAEVSLKRFRYCGKERDEETGFYYYGARFYAAWIGRFISIDPLAEEYPQLTPYNYAGNKTVTGKDLEGLQSTRDNSIKNDDETIFPDTAGVQKIDTIYINSESKQEKNNKSNIEKKKGLGEQFTIYEGELFEAQSSNGLAEAYIAKGSISTEAQRGWGNFTASGSVAEANAYFYPSVEDNNYLPGIDTGASFSVLSGEVDLRLGTKSNHIGGNARGTVLSANANLAAGLVAGNGKHGLLLDANAGAYVAEGDLSGRVSLFGIEGNWTLGGSVASAHAGVTGAFYIDTESKHIVISGFEHLGFGIGEKAGFELRIPIWGNEIFN